MTRASVRVPATPRIRITSRSGSVRVTGEARDDVAVEGAHKTRVDDDGTLEIKGASGAIEVRCPEGTDLVVGMASGGIDLLGRLGDARLTTASGSIRVERVRSLDARTASGSFEVTECAGECRLKTGSGTIRVGRVGTADLSTASGGVAAALVDGATVRTASGKVEIGLARPGTVDVHTFSGSISVSVPAGARPRTALKSKTGRVRCECPPGDDGEIRAKTLSGTVVVSEQ